MSALRKIDEQGRRRIPVRFCVFLDPEEREIRDYLSTLGPRDRSGVIREGLKLLIKTKKEEIKTAG